MSYSLFSRISPIHQFMTNSSKNSGGPLLKSLRGSSFILPWKYLVEAWNEAIFSAVEPYIRFGDIINHLAKLNDSRKPQLRL